MAKTYEELRKKYKDFLFRSFDVKKTGDEIVITYDFDVPDLTSFAPEIRIDVSNLDIVNDYGSKRAKNILFSLGMTEAVSYLKATCSPQMTVCRAISSSDADFFKKLYIKGLGEFFYKNSVTPDKDSFVTISPIGESCEDDGEEIIKRGTCLVPVGGGKDSAVTLELVKKSGADPLFFTVNDQAARTDTVTRAGFDKNKIIRCKRTISKELLRLNGEGFLNGHTPFSAIVAFLSYYCAYLTGREYIVLSNEKSANSANIAGSDINHQYSKSLEFENDFRAFTKRNFGGKIDYFSILRPFSELQIASEFSRHSQYFDVFRSCNVGSGKNLWCCSCAKCLFVFSMLSAFMEPRTLVGIFGENLLDKRSLAAEFDALTGITPVKPFECVGTAEEVRFALSQASKKYYKGEKPYLLKRFAENEKKLSPVNSSVLHEFDSDNNVPPLFASAVGEMYKNVSE